jgi:hypothetical protein
VSYKYKVISGFFTHFYKQTGTAFAKPIAGTIIKIIGVKMTNAGNMIENNALAALTKQASPHVTHAIKKASTKTGVDFSYLMEKAAAESSFNPKAEATTSSASGLYQFIESTWLNMVKKYGHKHGMEKYADHIDNRGKVSSEDMRDKILSLRKNPDKAALLAAEYAAENKRHMEKYVGQKVGSTELYLAHFMGASGATGFLKAKQSNPLSLGADLFPKEARANHNVFYDRKTGKPRTLTAIYDFFDKKFSDIKAPNENTGNSLIAKKPSGDASRNHASYTPLPIMPFPFSGSHNIKQNLMTSNVLEKIIPDLLFGKETTDFFYKTTNLLNPVELMLLAKTGPEQSWQS